MFQDAAPGDDQMPKTPPEGGDEQPETPADPNAPSAPVPDAPTPGQM